MVMNIPMIFQQFDLDKELLDKLTPPLPHENLDCLVNLPNLARAMKQSLLEKGYELWFSNVLHSGLPEQVLVGGTIGMDIKGDFHAAFGEGIQVPYGSGPYYSKQLLQD